MSRREDEIRLRHMLDHAREAAQMAARFTREDLDENRMLTLALVHLIEIIGEAAGRVSDETQAKHQEIPWSEIVGTRHRIVHGYDTINLDIVWSVITVDLPLLIGQLEGALRT